MSALAPAPAPYAVTQSNTVARAWFDVPIMNKWSAYALRGRCGNKRFQSTLAYCKVLNNMLLAFPSGKVVVCGSHSEVYAQLRILKLAVLLQRDFKIRARPMGMETPNMVGTASMGFHINLRLFQYDHPLETNADRFIGLHFFPAVCEAIPVKLTFVIFSTGKFIITGAKARRDLRTGYDYLAVVLPKYRIGHEHRQMTEIEIAAAAAIKVF